MHRSRMWMTAATAVAVVVAFGGANAAAEPVKNTGTPTDVIGTVVTLVTGDKVRVFGKGEIAVEPAAGREGIGFASQSRFGKQGNEKFVIPLDTLKLVNSGKLDRRLFNVTELVRLGYTGNLPLIITYADGASAANRQVRAATTTRQLPSINGAAVVVDAKGDSGFWSWLAGTSRFAGVKKVWLDGRAKPTLDASAPQIGAPAAWQAGLTGAGVTVGVIDTGVKGDHPDLSGKLIEQRDFTDSLPGGGDDIGHGTHVAGIIAGTGSASGGKYKGVAPDAKLVSAKVCVEFGCAESWIIAGMEWAAPLAKVVNMSLGGADSPEVDPVEEAVNSLTATHGTLFVIAAGNEGLPETVGSPASADAALAVGSVTKSDVTSDFSSQGPRSFDYAVKPDIGAPGSNIVAARSKGTPVGDANPVDDDYTRLSGTSMATPHVAGAAAILAQQNGEWKADRLKQTLMSSAKPTAGVFEQGAGRVDVARAFTQRVSATTGSLSYGLFRWPFTQPDVTKKVTYRNDSDATVPLTLNLALTGSDGSAAPAGLATVSASAVTIPAGGTADVTVTAHPNVGVAGFFSGRLTATGGNVAVQTAVGIVFEPESYGTTVRVISRTGHFYGAFGWAVNTTTGMAYDTRYDDDGVAVLRLPKGRYDFNAFDLSDDPNNAERPRSGTLVSRTNVEVGTDTTVTLDAHAGKPADFVVDQPGAKHKFGTVSLLSGAQGTGGAITLIVRATTQAYAVPTEKVTDHSYLYSIRENLIGDGSVFFLSHLEDGRVPAEPRKRVRTHELARVDTRYHHQGERPESSHFKFTFSRFGRPGTGEVFEFLQVPVPSRRVEYYTAETGVTFVQLLGLDSPESSGYEWHESIRSFRPGPYLAGWNRAPLGPAFGDPSEDWGVIRDGKKLNVLVSLFAGGDPSQATSAAGAEDGMTGTTTLSRNGVVLGTSDQPGFGQFDIPDSAGTYELRATAIRVVPWSVIGTAADVKWTFREPGAGAAVKPLPLLVVRAVGDVDEFGRAPAGRNFALVLHAQRQPGAPTSRLASLKVETSFDDGMTWRDAPSGYFGDVGYAQIRHPAGNGFVSLRITARDANGSTVVQTVTRAYQIVSTVSSFK